MQRFLLFPENMLVVLREIITEHDPCKAVVFLAFSQGPAAAALV